MTSKSARAFGAEGGTCLTADAERGRRGTGVARRGSVQRTETTESFVRVLRVRNGTKKARAVCTGLVPKAGLVRSEATE